LIHRVKVAPPVDVHDAVVIWGREEGMSRLTHLTSSLDSIPSSLPHITIAS